MNGPGFRRLTLTVSSEVYDVWDAHREELNLSALLEETMRQRFGLPPQTVRARPAGRKKRYRSAAGVSPDMPPAERRRLLKDVRDGLTSVSTCIEDGRTSDAVGWLASVVADLATVFDTAAD